jgi:hypothetical protein
LKFLYEYRTKDNVRHEGIIDAVSREAAFDALRGQGIKPGKLYEAPGLMNQVLGKGKRWLATIALGLTVVGFAVNYGLERFDTAGRNLYMQRSQIYGDPAFLRECEAKDWSNVFTEEGEQLLARFAQPGKRVDFTIEWVDKGEMNAIVASLKSGAGKMIKVFKDDSEEIAKIKRIVNGMKVELGEYMASGGSVEVYVERLIERQKIEARILENTKEEFKVLAQRGQDEAVRSEIIAKWNAKNQLLRDMGLVPIPLPQDWDE